MCGNLTRFHSPTTRISSRRFELDREATPTEVSIRPHARAQLQDNTHTHPMRHLRQILAIVPGLLGKSNLFLQGTHKLSSHFATRQGDEQVSDGGSTHAIVILAHTHISVTGRPVRSTRACARTRWRCVREMCTPNLGCIAALKVNVSAIEFCERFLEQRHPDGATRWRCEERHPVLAREQIIYHDVTPLAVVEET